MFLWIEEEYGYREWLAELTDEELGKTPRILQGALSDKVQLDELKNALNRGEKFSGVTMNYRKDGSCFKMAWIVIAPVNENYFVALQKLVEANDELEQLKTIQSIQQSILKKLNEVLPLGHTP